jgi:phage/plasmid-associated DNA primase
LDEDTAADFIDKCCILEPGAKIPTNELYEHYREWCENNAAFLYSKNLFGRKTAPLGINSKSINGVGCRIGVRLKNKRELLQ